MLESLVITLREGIEAALAVGIVLVYLNRSGRRELARVVYAGLACAIGASLAGAWILSRLPINGELTEGVLMIAAALLVISMVVWMQRHGRSLKRRIEERVEKISSSPARGGQIASGAAGAAAGIFLFTFLMVFREGMETVVMLAAVNMTSDALLEFAGGILGIALAVAFGVAFVKGSARVDLARFFKVTAVVLCVFAAQLLIGGAHELAEGGILPLGRREMTIVGPIVEKETLFVAALLAIPLMLLVFPATRGRNAAASVPADALSAPERRQLMARARRERTWRIAAGAGGLLIIVSLTASYAYTRVPRVLDPPTMLAGGAEEVRLPAAGLDDGHLHRFGVDAGGTVVRFFVMKGEGGKLVSSLDACEVCGASGYVEEKSRLVCRTCAADIVPSTIGVGGGCNPIPLASRLEGGDLVLSMRDLRARVEMFRAGEGS